MRALLRPVVPALGAQVCLGGLVLASQTADCLADDLGALAEGEAYLVLPRLRIVGKGGERDGGDALGFW